MTVPVSNIYVRFSNTAIDYTGFGMNVANVNCNANASIMKLSVNGNTVFRVDMDGNFGNQREIIWIPAKAMLPSVTAGAVFEYRETTTNKILFNTLLFSRPDNQSAQFDVLMPKSWNKGPIRYRVVSQANTTSGTVLANALYALQAVAISDADSLIDPLMTSNCYVVAEGSDSTILNISPESPYMTIDGAPQESDWVTFKLTREVSNVADTFTMGSSLYGVQLILNPNNNN